MLIDFTEIPPSNSTGKSQDIFEKFSRDFLEGIGYQIVTGPARGADGGIDLKVREVRKGIGGETEIYWLVSCKHYAHTGKSITKDHEIDIRDRVEKHGCSGFIGLYTTIANQSLLNSLEGMKEKIGYQLFDNEKIENYLIGVHSNERLMMSYFPQSYKKWKDLYYYTEPVKLLDKYIENTYGDEKSLFYSLFHSTGNFIKTLRAHDDLKSALKNCNIEHIIVPKFEEGWKLAVDYSYIQLLEKMIGEAEKVLNVQIKSEMRGLSITIKHGLSYILFANFLLVSPGYNKELNLIFKDLKEIIN